MPKVKLLFCDPSFFVTPSKKIRTEQDPVTNRTYFLVGDKIIAVAKRPSGHKAMGLHKRRHEEADRVWLFHDLPTITHRRDGTYVYDGPETRPSVASKEAQMAKIGPKEQQRIDMRVRNAKAAARGEKTRAVTTVTEFPPCEMFAKRTDEPAASAPAEQQEKTVKTKTKAEEDPEEDRREEGGI